MVCGVTGRIPQGSDCVRPADASNPTQLSCCTWQVEDHTGKTTEKKEVCADYRSYESQPWTEMNKHTNLFSMTIELVNWCLLQLSVAQGQPHRLKYLGHGSV